MRLNFDFQGIFKSVKLNENTGFDNCIKLYDSIKGYAAKVFNSCEEDISLFLEGKPFVLSSLSYKDISNKLIKVRKNIESGLKGGKGGFGATIKSQKKKLNIKKIDIGDCRDLRTGRRIRDILKDNDNNTNLNEKESDAKKAISNVTENSNKGKKSTSSYSDDLLKYADTNKSPNNEVLKHYQTHILNLEDKWRSISSSIDFGFTHFEKNIVIETNN